METMTKENTLLQSQLLDMGWTKTMIQRYLPAPIEKRNRQYPHSAPYKLYDKAVVLAAMENDEVKAKLEKLKNRREAELKEIEAEREKRIAEREKRKAEIIAAAQSMNITVVPEEEWISEAIRDWKVSNIIALGRFRNNEPIRVNCKNVKKDELPEIAVFYISTHFVSGNEEDYSRYCGYPLFYAEILKKIAKAYPKYADECNRQIVDTKAAFGC